MTNHNLQHKWLSNSDLSCCSETDIWSLCYVDGMFCGVMFCALCQSHNGMHPQSKSTVCNKDIDIDPRQSVAIL